MSHIERMLSGATNRGTLGDAHNWCMVNRSATTKDFLAVIRAMVDADAYEHEDAIIELVREGKKRRKLNSDHSPKLRRLFQPHSLALASCV